MMSRGTHTSQMPVYLGNYHRGSGSIFSRRGMNDIGSSNVDVHVYLNEIENVLTAYSGTDDNSCETHQSSVRKIGNLIYSKQTAESTAEDAYSENVVERDYSNSADDLKFRNIQDEYVSLINKSQISDRFSVDESGVYVVLRSEASTSENKSKWKENIQPGTDTDQREIRSKPAISFDHATTHLPDTLTASVILEPLSTQIRYQPYLRVDQFSDTESVVSTEVNKKEYFKKLKEFEHSLEDSVDSGKLKTTMNDHIKNDVVKTNKNDENKILENNGHAKNQLSTRGNGKTNKENTETQNIQCTNEDETNTDVKVSLEDIIQDFLQYFQTKRLSVKMSGEKPHLGGENNETLAGEACGYSQHETGMEELFTGGEGRSRKTKINKHTTLKF